ncbi:plasmid replication initiator TrfA [Thioalkalivibrio thiocyanoxidans]|uniref:plasmid replication initiator TrfA n=1 Tax=Thioalkalivibrio thiocyanoxidans TaxID=152475 RepID=UPI0003686C4E|nr:plasmid replication initiator TrfA [Thioalkalivibrio thiocyanoxidans]
MGGMRHAADDALTGRLQRLQQMAGSRRPAQDIDAQHNHATAGASEPPAQPATWADSQRGVSNWLIRSSLFGIVRRGCRTYMHEEVLASQGSNRIVYTGERLDMADSEVWDQCIHYWAREAATEREMPDRIQFRPGRLLREIGRSTGTSDRRWLDRVLDRLTPTMVHVIGGDGTTIYRGQLIGPSGIDRVSREYTVDMHPDLIALYGRNQYTRLDADQIAAVRRHPTAHWLFRHYASHREPHPVRPEYLRDLSGAAISPRVWRQRLPGALDRVCGVTGWSWRMEGGLIQVSRTPGVWA